MAEEYSDDNLATYFGDTSDPTIDYSGYGNLTGPELARLAADMASNAGTSGFGLKDLADLAKRLMSGKGSTSEYGNLASILAGLYSANRSSGPTILNPGYQGGIPQVTATRTMLREPPAGRRPGSGGINYGGDVTYARTGQNLTAENAGISSPASRPLGGTPTFTQPAAYDLPSLLALIQQVQQFRPSATGSGASTGSGATTTQPGTTTTPTQPGTTTTPTQPGTTTAAPGGGSGATQAAASTSPFVTGGSGAGSYRGFGTKEEYDRAVAAKAAQDARERAELEAYQVTGKSGFGDLYARAKADPSLLTKLHNESDADALMRLKANIMNAEQRLARREALAEKAKREGVANEFAIDGQFTPAPVRPGYLAPTDPLTETRPISTVAPTTPTLSTPVQPPTPVAPPSGGGLQDLFQQVYGRAGSESEVQNLAGKSQDEARRILETSLANWRASQAMSQSPQQLASQNSGIMEAARGGLVSDGFVVPADVVSHLGNGSSEAGLKMLASKFGARPIKGDGDGMSDSIPTKIDGRQEARVANEEAFISPEVVKRIGDGDTERGAKKLYAMMARIRKARTGTTEQGKEINPEKFMPGGQVNGYQTGGAITTNPSAGVSSSSLAEWVGPFVADLLSKGKALSESPYEAYTGPLTAGASPLQQLAFVNSALFRPSANIGQAAGLAGGLAALAPNLRYTPQTTSFLGDQNVSGLDVAPSYLNVPSPAQPQTSGMPYSSGDNLPTSADMPRRTPSFLSPQSQGVSTNKLPPGYPGSEPVIMDGDGAFAPPGSMRPTNKMPPGYQADGAAMAGLPSALTPPADGGSIAQRYMNPFIETALNPQLRELTRQSDIARMSDAARLAKAGAFGGSRQAIMEAEGRRNLLESQSDVLGKGYATAYDKAMAQFNADQDRRMAEAQYGAKYGLEGIRTGLDAAKTQGDLGSTETKYALEGIRSLADLGKTQRDIEAEGIAADKAQFEEARLNPFKMLQFQQSLLSGLPLASQSLVQPGQSNLQQFAGGATTVYELLKGLGVIK